MGGKFSQSLATRKKVLPESGCKGIKFSQIQGTGRKGLPESACGGKVLLESGYKGKKFSWSQVMGEKVLLESGCGEKNFSLGNSNTRGLKSQLDTSMSKGHSVPVLWKGNVLDAQTSHPSCSWCVLRDRLRAQK